MIGICIASNKEWNFIKEYYKDEIDKIDDYIYGEYFKLIIFNKKLIVYKCGSRKCTSSAATQYIIDNFKIEKIILVGTAAGINFDKDKLLDIFVPSIALQSDCSYIEKGEDIDDKFKVVLNKDNEITIASREKALIYKEDCDVYKKLGVTLVDMESGAIANICKLNNIPLVIIKGISDFPGNYDYTDERQYKEYLMNSSLVMEKILKEYLIKYL